MQGSHEMWKALKFMSTTYKTFDEFPSVLDLPVFSFYWKLVQHAVQFRGDINALLLTNETKILKKIAKGPFTFQRLLALLRPQLQYIIQILQSMGFQMISWLLTNQVGNYM